MSLTRFGKNRLTSELLYTEEERLTGYQWINEKRIYRKTIDCGALPNATSTTINLGIINLDEIISIRGIAKSTASFIPLPYPAANPIEVFCSGTQITITAGTDRSAFTESYVIIEYTKNN